MTRRTLTALGTALAVGFSAAGDASAQGISLIRDAEIEATIRAYTQPLFQIAGLNPNAIDVYLVDDDRLNAFVAGGQNIFVNTGLLLASNDPGGVIGVLAHETGHIAGGHLAQLHAELREVSAQTILAYLLGAAAAVAAGRGDVGAAVISGSTGMGQRSLLAYSRAQEAAADQAAVNYLDRVGWSAVGLADFLELLEDQELLTASLQDPYLRSHPLTRDRVDQVQGHVARSPYSNAQFPPAFYEMHERMRAKLIGYTQGVARTLQVYPEIDVSLPARYARAIAYANQGSLANALPLIDSLLADLPNDPYFLELKGQVLFEHGRIAESIAPLRQASALLPDAAPIRLLLARAELESQDPAKLAAVIDNLSQAARLEPDNPAIWYFLSIAHGRAGDLGMAALAMAERNFHAGSDDEARQQAIRAQQNLPEGSPGWLRAQDIISATDD